MGSDIMTGEWKGFEFKLVLAEDFPKALLHLRESFYKDEPIQVNMGMNEDRANDLDKRISPLLAEMKSFMAICKETKKIAGLVILSKCLKKDKDVPVDFNPTSPITMKVRHFIDQVQNKVDIFEKYEVDYFGCLFILSTSKEFRGCGLGYEMFQRGIQYFKDNSYPIIECTFSNPFSRRIGEKFGFVEIARMRMIDAKDVSGNLIMPNADPTQFVNATILDLRNSS